MSSHIARFTFSLLVIAILILIISPTHSHSLSYSPESMGLPSSYIYILLLFLFIPFRYFSDPSFSPFKAWITPLSTLLSTTRRSNNIIITTTTPSFDQLNSNASGQDGKGWSGDIGGREGFPHHEVSILKREPEI